MGILGSRQSCGYNLTPTRFPKHFQRPSTSSAWQRHSRWPHKLFRDGPRNFSNISRHWPGLKNSQIPIWSIIKITLDSRMFWNKFDPRRSNSVSDIGSDPSRLGHKTSGGVLWFLAPRQELRFLWFMWVGRWTRLVSDLFWLIKRMPDQIRIEGIWRPGRCLKRCTLYRPYQSSISSVAGHVVLLWVHVKWFPREWQDPRFPSRTLQCYKLITSYSLHPFFSF